jgi:predicted transposase YbfD/YdcC
VVYLITRLSATQAPPLRLLELIRGHWRMEHGLHAVRDVTFGEDGSRMRTGNAPQLMAALRHLAIPLIHRRGSRQIAATRRHFALHPRQALKVVLHRKSPSLHLPALDA